MSATLDSLTSRTNSWPSDAADERQAWLERMLSAKSAAWLETLRELSLDLFEPVDHEGEDQ